MSRRIAGLLTALLIAGFGSATFSMGGLNPLEVIPGPPVVDKPMNFQWIVPCPEGYFSGGGAEVNRVVVNAKLSRVFVSFTLWATDPDSLTCSAQHHAYPIRVKGLSEPGNYRFNFYHESSSPAQGDYFHRDNLVSSFHLGVFEESSLYRQEVPFEDSLQSGIGLVRGWACNAESVEIQFDDLPRENVAYGSSRTDTEPLCGDDNNGYGMVVAWGSLGLGRHSMKTFIDGIEVSEVAFEVVGLDQPFLKGLAATYTLDDFPEAGQSVIVQWSEPDQNFIVVEQRP